MPNQTLVVSLSIYKRSWPQRAGEANGCEHGCSLLSLGLAFQTSGLHTSLRLLTSKYVGAATFCSAVCLQTKIFKNAASWGVTDRVKGFITRQCVSVTEKHIGRNAVIRQWQDNIHWTGFVLRSDTGLKKSNIGLFLLWVTTSVNV